MSPLALLRLPQVPRLLVSALVGRLPNGMVPLALVLFARATGARAMAGPGSSRPHTRSAAVSADLPCRA